MNIRNQSQQTKKKEPGKAASVRQKKPKRPTSVKPDVEPPSAKEPSKMRKHGVEPDVDEEADDERSDGITQHVLLTGVYDPSIIENLISIGVSVHNIIKISVDEEMVLKQLAQRKLREKTSLLPVEQVPEAEKNAECQWAERQQALGRFWAELEEQLDGQFATGRLRDVVALNYSVRTQMLPDCLSDEQAVVKFPFILIDFSDVTLELTNMNVVNCGKLIYNELVPIIYDLVDFRRQWKNYLAHVKLLAIPRLPESQRRPCTDPLHPTEPKRLSHSFASKVKSSIAEEEFVEMSTYNSILEDCALENIQPELILHAILEQVVESESGRETVVKRAPSMPEKAVKHISATVKSLLFEDQELQAKSSGYLLLTQGANRNLAQGTNNLFMRSPLPLGKPAQQIPDLESELLKRDGKNSLPPPPTNAEDKLRLRLGPSETAMNTRKSTLSLMEATLQSKGCTILSKSDGSAVEALDLRTKWRLARNQQLVYFAARQGLSDEDFSEILNQLYIESIDFALTSGQAAKTQDRNHLNTPVLREQTVEPPCRTNPFDDPYIPIPLLAEALLLEEESVIQKIQQTQLDSRIEEVTETSEFSGSESLVDSARRSNSAISGILRHGSSRRSRSRSSSRKSSAVRFTCQEEEDPSPQKKEDDHQSNVDENSQTPLVELLISQEGLLGPQDAAEGRQRNSLFHMDRSRIKELFKCARKRDLSNWCLRERLTKDQFTQRAFELLFEFPYIKIFKQRRNNGELVVFHKNVDCRLPSSYNSQYSWMHTGDLGFRAYLHTMSDKISSWTKEQEAFYQANLLSNEIKMATQALQQQQQLKAEAERALTIPDKATRTKSGKGKTESKHFQSPMMPNDSPPAAKADEEKAEEPQTEKFWPNKVTESGENSHCFEEGVTYFTTYFSANLSNGICLARAFEADNTSPEEVKDSSTNDLQKKLESSEPICTQHFKLNLSTPEGCQMQYLALQRKNADAEGDVTSPSALLEMSKVIAPPPPSTLRSVRPSVYYDKAVELYGDNTADRRSSVAEREVKRILLGNGAVIQLLEKVDFESPMGVRILFPDGSVAETDTVRAAFCFCEDPPKFAELSIPSIESYTAHSVAPPPPPPPSNSEGSHPPAQRRTSRKQSNTQSRPQLLARQAKGRLQSSSLSEALDPLHEKLSSSWEPKSPLWLVTLQSGERFWAKRVTGHLPSRENSEETTTDIHSGLMSEARPAATRWLVAGSTCFQVRRIFDPSSGQTLCTRFVDDLLRVEKGPGGCEGVTVQHPDGTRQTTFYYKNGKDPNCQGKTKFVRVECPGFPAVAINPATSEMEVLLVGTEGTKALAFADPRGYFAYRCGEKSEMQFHHNGSVVFMTHGTAAEEHISTYLFSFHKAENLLEVTDSENNAFSVDSLGNCNVLLDDKRDSVEADPPEIDKEQSGATIPSALMDVVDRHPQAFRFFSVSADGQCIIEHIGPLESTRQPVDAVSNKTVGLPDAPASEPSSETCDVCAEDSPSSEDRKLTPANTVSAHRPFSRDHQTAYMEPSIIPPGLTAQNLNFALMHSKGGRTAGTSGGSMAAKAGARHSTTAAPPRDSQVYRRRYCNEPLSPRKRERFPEADDLIQECNDQLQGGVLTEEEVEEGKEEEEEQLAEKSLATEFVSRLRNELQQAAINREILRRKFVPNYFFSPEGREFLRQQALLRQVSDKNSIELHNIYRTLSSSSSPSSSFSSSSSSSSSSPPPPPLPPVPPPPPPSPRPPPPPRPAPHGSGVKTESRIPETGEIVDGASHQESDASATDALKVKPSAKKEVARGKSKTQKDPLVFPKAQIKPAAHRKYDSNPNFVYYWGVQDELVDPEDLCITSEAAPQTLVKTPNIHQAIVEDPYRMKVLNTGTVGRPVEGKLALRRLRGLRVMPEVVDLGRMHFGGRYSTHITLFNGGVEPANAWIRNPPKSLKLSISYTKGQIPAGLSRKVTITLEPTSDEDFLNYLNRIEDSLFSLMVPLQIRTDTHNIILPIVGKLSGSPSPKLPPMATALPEANNGCVV
ncbi:Sperm-associated antigen 17 [Sparganum proliferum]